MALIDSQQLCEVYQLDSLSNDGVDNTEQSSCFIEHCPARVRLCDGIVEIVAGPCDVISRMDGLTMRFARSQKLEVESEF